MAATSSLSTMHWLASDIYKADVYDNAEDKIGEVTDLIVGGFLGGETSARQPAAERSAVAKKAAATPKRRASSLTCDIMIGFIRKTILCGHGTLASLRD